ncbi:DUF6093 family protein [Brevibacterium linens]|uniref:DUF6093 family protein n=1 Tax=Brevibacterium linens TaxID=1703 RepID=UPI003BF521A5
MDAGALLAGRARAEQMMKDQCIIRRVIGETTDRETGKVVPVYDAVYNGRCKLQSYEGYEQEKNTAGTALTVQRMSVHLPVGAYRINVGDFVEITGSRMDPLLVGRKFRITQEAPFKTFATAYRVFVDYIAD